MTKKFEQFDRERKKKRVLLLEYQKEARKKLMENQYLLKNFIDNVRASLETQTDISEEERAKILRKLEVLEQNGEYQDILKIAELRNVKNFADFKSLVSSQQQVNALI